MANRWWRPAGVNTLWSNDDGGGGFGSNWSSDVDGGAPAAKPTADDAVFFDGGSLSGCTIDANAVAASIDLSGYTAGGLTINAGVTLDVGGAISGDANTASVITNNGTIQGCPDTSAGDVTWSGTGVIDLDVAGTLKLSSGSENQQVNFKAGAGVTVTAGANFTCKGLDLTGGAGTFAWASKVITVHGGGYKEDGTATLSNIGSIIFAADTSVATCHYTSNLAKVTVNPDVTVTLSGYVIAADFDLQGTVALNTKYLWLRPTASTAWTQTGTISGTGQVALDGRSQPAGGTTVGDIDAGTGASVRVMWNTNGETLTLGNVTATFLDFNNSNAAASVRIVGNLTLTDATWAVKYDFNDASLALGSGVHSMAGKIDRVTGDETGCSLALENSSTRLGGTLNGTALVVTSNGAHIHGGTIQNVDVGRPNPIHLFGGTRGAGNGMGVVACPSPISGSCAVMAA